MMGTGAAGCVVPVAAAPFGMVQLGPDTYFTSSGYHYDHDVIYGFSHTHKSGGGGTDFQDIMFFPVADSAWQRLEVYPDRVGSRFSHEREHVEPGYYRVRLLDSDIEAELTATSRCGMHRYAYPDGAARQLIVDLKHGCQHSTTIFADEDFDTVKVSRLEWVDERTVRGFRISNGWAPEQHVYFYAEFSEPIRSCRFFDRGRSGEGGGVVSAAAPSFFISTPPTTKTCTLLSSIVGSDLSISAGRMQRTMSASVLRGSPLMQELSSNSDRGKMRVKIFSIEEHLDSRSPHSDENREWSKDNPHGFTFPNKKRKKRTAVTFRSRRRCTL